jgi:hypothetical protein
MDGLTNALGRLEAPDCVKCHVNMKWLRSEFMRDVPVPVAAHLFLYLNRERAQRMDSKFSGGSGPVSRAGGASVFALCSSHAQ